MKNKNILKYKNHTALHLYYISFVTYSYKNVFNLPQNCPYHYITHSPVWSMVDQHLLNYLANTFEVKVWLMYKHKHRLAISLKPDNVYHSGWNYNNQLFCHTGDIILLQLVRLFFSFFLSFFLPFAHLLEIYWLIDIFLFFLGFSNDWYFS